MVPVRPTTGDSAQLIQWLAGQVAYGIGIALGSSEAIRPAPLRVPRQGVAVVRQRIDRGTLRARSKIHVPEVLVQGESAGRDQVPLSAFGRISRFCVSWGAQRQGGQSQQGQNGCDKGHCANNDSRKRR